jgi:hypothetical protein
MMATMGYTYDPAHGLHERLATPGGGGRSWLHARLDVRPPQQDRVLAERLPRVLENLPAGVDRWHFLRGGGADAHLRLSFGGQPGPLWTDLLDEFQDWIGELTVAQLATRLIVDVWPRAASDPAAVAGADDVMHTDSCAVLGQLRLARAGAFAIAPAVLAELGRDDITRAFRGDPRRHSGVPELATLTYWREERAEAVRRYGDRIRRLAADNDDPRLAPTVLNRLLRMHSNRVLGRRRRVG